MTKAEKLVEQLTNPRTPGEFARANGYVLDTEFGMWREPYGEDMLTMEEMDGMWAEFQTGMEWLGEGSGDEFTN